MVEGDRPESDKSISSLQAALALACPVCHKTFEGRNCKQNLGFHMVIHTGEKPHQCPYCPHKSALRHNLQKHIRTIHRDIQHVLDQFSLGQNTKRNVNMWEPKFN